MPASIVCGAIVGLRDSIAVIPHIEFLFGGCSDGPGLCNKR